MIPFTNTDGLRDYRVPLVRTTTPRRWPWLVLLAFLVGLLVGAIR